MSTKEISQLVAEVNASRNAVSRDVTGLLDELNFARRTAISVRKNPFAWLGSATFGGYLFSRLLCKEKSKKQKNDHFIESEFSDKKKRKKEIRSLTFFGFLLSTLRLALPLLRPLLSAYASKRLSDMAFSLTKEK